LDDNQNACQAHFTASKSANGSNALPVVNYTTFLFNSDSPKYRDSIIQLMMEFEQLWLKRKQNSVEFEENVMKAATRLANALNVSNHRLGLKKRNNKTQYNPQVIQSAILCHSKEISISLPQTLPSELQVIFCYILLLIYSLLNKTFINQIRLCFD
jgi:hypothetical protein